MGSIIEFPKPESSHLDEGERSEPVIAGGVDGKVIGISERLPDFRVDELYDFEKSEIKEDEWQYLLGIYGIEGALSIFIVTFVKYYNDPLKNPRNNSLKEIPLYSFLQFLEKYQSLVVFEVLASILYFVGHRVNLWDKEAINLAIKYIRSGFEVENMQRILDELVNSYITRRKGSTRIIPLFISKLQNDHPDLININPF